MRDTVRQALAGTHYGGFHRTAPFPRPALRRGPSCFLLQKIPVTYLAYLDEFGHIGHYVSREDPKHNDSPVFGLTPR